MKQHQERLQRTTGENVIIFTDEEELFRKKFITEKLASDVWKCTICSKSTKDKPFPHPALRVSICFDCHSAYQSAVFLINKDGTDKNCCWCTKQAKKYNCTSCTVTFCKDCLERNFGTDFVRNTVVNNVDWNCFICYPKPLWRLRVACIQALENNNSSRMEEVETIDLLSQVSEDRLPFSQQALPYSETHNEQFSPELEPTIISPKKVAKPIAEFDDDNDSLWRTQQSINRNNNDESHIKQELSAAEKESLSSVVFKQTEEDFQWFSELFSKRIVQFSQKFKCENINSYAQANKLVNKISEFCGKAIENLENLNETSQVRFQVWNNSVKSAKIQKETYKDETKQSEIICDNIPLQSKCPAKIKSSNNKSIVKSKNGELNQSSTSKTIKNKPKRKYSLSLKTPPKEPENKTRSIEYEDTLDFIERIKQKLPDDVIPPKKNPLLLSVKRKISEVENTFVNQINKKHSPVSKTEGETEESPIQQAPEDSLTSINHPKNIQSTNTNSENNTLNNLIEDCSLQIKSEQDTRSEISNETIIRAKTPSPVEHITIKGEPDAFETQTFNGEEELQARIQTDFDEDSPITVRIENYLCETTGEFCQSYRTGFDNIEDEDENSTIPENTCNFSDDYSDSDKTEDYDWNADLIDLTKNEINNSDHNQNKTTDDINIKEEDKDNKLLEEIATVNNQEPEKAQETVKEEPESSDTSDDEQTSVLKKDKNSDAETISDTEYDREAAFRALRSDVSESESSPSDTDSDDSDDSCDKESHVDKIAYESGYVEQLNLAAEIDKLLGKNQEISNEPHFEDDRRNESSAVDEPVEDPKLRMNAIVLLDKKFSMNPIVVLERSKIEELDDDDSDVQIRRLLDLDSLKKRNIILTSDSESDITETREKRKKKKVKKLSSKSSETSSSSESERSFKTEVSSDFVFDLTQQDKDYVPNIDDMLDDSLSEEILSEEDDVIEVKEKKKPEKMNDEILITDEDEPEKSATEDDGKSNWRKDKLLTGALTISNSDTDTTNDSTANQILQKQEERYLQNVDKEKPTKKSSTDDAIVLSDDDSDDDDSDTDDSDIQFIGLKRKRESDEEGSQTLNKKGRRNIREVLKDNELQEETKIADKLEIERKERLTQKQKKLDSLLSESQEEVGFVLDIDEELKEPVVTVHHSLVPRLKEHQKKGIKFMWDGCFESVAELKRIGAKGTGCILAHCMGLGKTMQVVVLAHTLLTHENTNVKHVLIICPLSTVFNWRNEFEQTLKVCPKKIGIFDIRPDRQKNFHQKMFEVKRWNTNGGVLILGYESFQSLVKDANVNKFGESYKQVMLESLIDPGPNLVVCDEGHMLKNGKTVRFTSLSRIKTERRIILTGTPLQNNLIEYYYMVNFVKPHLLGTLEEYKNRFVNPISNGQYEDSNSQDINLMKRRSHILHKKLETTVQRYEESELAPYLPEKFDYVLYTQLTPLQIKLYEHYLQLIDRNTKQLFKTFHAFQNIWTHPGLLKIKFDKRKEPTPKQKQKHYDEVFVPVFDPDSNDTIGLETDWFKDLLPEDILTNISYGAKMEILFSVIKECEAVKDKLLIFSSSIDELDLIESFLKQRQGETWIKGVDYHRMDGTVVPEKRTKYCNDFNNESNQRSRVFLVSHKVGGLGLNLTAANRVVLMDVSWNPAYDIQSVFRIYRFGQTKTCFIYRFVSMGTMEEVVYSRAVTKLAISCRVVDEHQIKRHFNSDDLQRMYRLIKDFGEPPTLAVPSDRLLAKLWETHKPLLYKFCDHQSLLENLAHEELNEEEMKNAWDEFRNEVDREKETKEMANNRYNYIQQPQQQLADMSNFAPLYPQLPQSIMRPLDFQRPTYQQPDNIRYKLPNKLPSQTEILNRAYLKQMGYGSPFHNHVTSLLNKDSPSTSVSPAVPSTSGYQNQNTSLVNKGAPTSDVSTPSTSGYIPVASTLINPSFPAVSNSVNPNFSTSNAPALPSTNASILPANQNRSGYNPNSVKTLATWQIPNEKANSRISQIKNPVPTLQVYQNPFAKIAAEIRGLPAIRNNGNNTYGNQISNPNTPSVIVKYKPSGQKENVQQNFEKSVENLNQNGVSVLSKNDTSNKMNAQQIPKPLVQNYLTK